MNLSLYAVSVTWLSFCFLITFKAGIDNPSLYLTGDVAVNCGSKETSAANNCKEWVGDTHPKSASLMQIKGSSTISSVTNNCILADPIPYKNARISRSTFSYTFHIEPGQKFIRLHFNPTSYNGFQRFKDLFTVEAGSFTLLRNFSASLTADALGLKSFAKEFCVNVLENQQLKLVFSSQSQDTYAFINRIEIKSVPSPYSYLHGVGIGKSTVLEMVHREKVKRDSLLPSDDSSHMFRLWETHPKEKSNEINNIKWKIPVYVGFRYLVRLHFSEITEAVDVILKVLGKEMIADIVIEREKNVVLKYRDYLVLMTGCKEEKRVLLIYLQSNERFLDGERPLTGFEIFKISNHDNSLASPNPMPLELSSPYWTIESLFSVLGHRNAIPTVSFTIIALISSIVYKLREFWEADRKKEENKPSPRAQRFCRCFSLEEMKLGTKNFSHELLIGKGGFGNVYKGIIDNGGETVAVKRLKPSSKQGATEFLTEIETLSELKHVNLVSLIGYCNEPGEMILVYDYMPGGTLSGHLHNLTTNKNNLPSLTWKQCLSICIGAGRGLDYLHTGCAIIHRDVKASNILLDENLMAKVSDFGIAIHENESKLLSQDSTHIKGTPGYFDPHYLSHHELTRKIDIYAFGVVLLEVLCGKPAFDRRVAQDEQFLTKWATDKISKGEVDQIVSASLREEISPDSLKSFLKISERCLHDEPKNRPAMAQVVQQLEFVLEQHESTVQNATTNVTDYIGPSNDANNKSAATIFEQAFNIIPNEDSQNTSNKETHRPTRHGPLDELHEKNENRQNMSKISTAEPSSIKTAEVQEPSSRGPWDKSHEKNERPMQGNFLANFGTRIREAKMAGKGENPVINRNLEVPRFAVWEADDIITVVYRNARSRS